MPWSTPFDDPIPLHGGRRLATLQQAADYVMALPETVQHEAHWQVAVENLINAAETGGGWLMFARIAVLRRSMRTEKKASQLQWPSPPLSAVAAAPAWVQAPKLRLLDRGADFGEFRAERAADAVDGGDDHDADAGRNDAIFDGGSTAFIVDKSCQ
jgi:hypothetical protein